MPLPTSGQITFEGLRTEYGGGNPVYMSQYYRGAGLVPDNAANGNIPTSGTIWMSQFYGGTKASPLSVSAPDVRNQVTSGTAAGSSVASASGGTAPYSYQWANSSSTTMTVSGATATFRSTVSRSGTATVTVTDATGAQASKTIFVELTVGRPV